MSKAKAARKCCQSAKHADTGLYSRGKHNHPAGMGVARTAIWHATGEGFRKDQSTTDAIAKRMRALGRD